MQEVKLYANRKRKNYIMNNNVCDEISYLINTAFPYLDEMRKIIIANFCYLKNNYITCEKVFS